eukprot:354792-Chlamydomonas_euryale.AAC.2
MQPGTRSLRLCLWSGAGKHKAECWEHTAKAVARWARSESTHAARVCTSLATYLNILRARQTSATARRGQGASWAAGRPAAVWSSRAARWKGRGGRCGSASWWGGGEVGQLWELVMVRKWGGAGVGAHPGVEGG